MEIERIAALLREMDVRRVKYILVGAMAMNVLGMVRATEDVDLFLPNDKENLERVKDALRAVWNDPEIEEIRDQDLSFGVIRYGPPDGRIVVDLITHLGEAFRYDDLEAQTIRWEGIDVRVATPRTLYCMKKDTTRLQDRADAELIRSKFGLKAD